MKLKNKNNNISNDMTNGGNSKKNKRKIESFKIEFDELKPVTIGYFESRKKASLGVLAVIIPFILFIIFLPDISDWLNELFNPETPNVLMPINPNNPINPNDENKEEDMFKVYSNNMTIQNEELSISEFNINKDTKTLSYKITNLSNKTNIESLNYYIEIYSNERTLMERVKLVKKLTLNKSYTSNIIVNDLKEDTANSVGYIVVVKKNVNEYPEVELKSTNEGTNLICVKNNENITYSFEDNKLKKVNSNITYKNTDIGYDAGYENNRELVSNYNKIDGIFSNIVKYEEGYDITTKVDLDSVSNIYVFNADVFELNVLPKVVSFEMEAQGFNCE